MFWNKNSGNFILWLQLKPLNLLINIVEKIKFHAIIYGWFYLFFCLNFTHIIAPDSPLYFKLYLTYANKKRAPISCGYKRGGFRWKLKLINLKQNKKFFFFIFPPFRHRKQHWKHPHCACLSSSSPIQSVKSIIFSFVTI